MIALVAAGFDHPRKAIGDVPDERGPKPTEGRKAAQADRNLETAAKGPCPKRPNSASDRNPQATELLRLFGCGGCQCQTASEAGPGGRRAAPPGTRTRSHVALFPEGARRPGRDNRRRRRDRHGGFTPLPQNGTVQCVALAALRSHEEPWQVASRVVGRPTAAHTGGYLLYTCS